MKLKLITFMFVLVLLAGQATALSVYTTWDNNQNYEEIQPGEDNGYYVVVTNDIGFDHTIIEANLFDTTNGAPEKVKQLFQETTNELHYMPAMFTLKSEDYNSLPGNYFIDIKASELLNGQTITNSKQINLKVLGERDTNQPPVAEFTYTPSNPKTNEEITFTSTSTDDKGIAKEEWFITKTFIAEGKTLKYTFNQEGTYAVKLVVTDTDGETAEITKQITISQAQTPIIIKNFDCNTDISGDGIGDVVQGETLRCAIELADDLEDATITFDWEGTGNFQTCETDFKGQCHSDITVTDTPGIYETTATATKTGYTTDSAGPLQIEVWQQRYDITNLKVYKDEYVTEEDTFYRAKPMYVSFEITDTITGNTVSPDDSDTVESVHLKVHTDSAKLEERTSQGNEHRYWLENIPITDNFLGEGKVFAFTVNFADHTAGQEDTDVTILNNPLQFNPVQTINIAQGQTGSLDLNQFLSDIETPVSQIITTHGATGTLSISKVGTNKFHVTAPNDYTGQTQVAFTADDTDGSTQTKTITFIANIPENKAPIASFNMPGTAEEDTQVTLTSTSYDPDGTITNHEWSLNGNIFATGVSETTRTFTTPGTYTISLKVTDNDGATATAQKQIIITKKDEGEAPTANFEWQEPVYVNELITFTSTSTDDGTIIKEEWDLNNDGIFEKTGRQVSTSYATKGQKQVTLKVTDNDNIQDTITKTIDVKEKELNILSYACNEYVVKGEEQHCTLNLYEDIKDALVTFTYNNGEYIGECTTNFKGMCHINPIINKDKGTYYVDVKVEKPGYTTDTASGVSFEVLEKRYIVENLKIYEDEFVTEEDTFYRANPMYASFDVYDLFTNKYVKNTEVIKHVFLKVNNGDPENFTEWTEPIQLKVRETKNHDSINVNENSEFKYWLESIPITDEFLGQGKVFAFVFDFSMQEAGQQTRNVNILNNEASFNPPSMITIEYQNPVTLDLKDYVDDVETPANEFEWARGDSGKFIINYNGNGVYTISAPQEQTTQTVFFTADDTDGSTITKGIVLTTQGDTTSAPIAVIDAPSYVKTKQEITLDGSKSYDPDGDALISYDWKITLLDDTVHTATGTKITYEFQTEALHRVQLTVTDSTGKQGTTTTEIISEPERRTPNIPLGGEDGLWVDYFDVYGINYGTITIGEQFSVEATLTNSRSERLRDVRVTFSLPELGYWESSMSTELRAGETKNVDFMADLPFFEGEIEPGEYTGLITVSADKILRTKYFPIIIE